MTKPSEPTKTPDSPTKARSRKGAALTEVPADSPGVESALPSSDATAPIDRVVQLYGDMVFDLCESVLWSPVNAQLAFRAILKTLRRRRVGHGFVEHERAWVLQIATQKLLDLSTRHVRRLTPSEQIQLDSAQNIASKLKQFESYFHRLPAEDQILLLLRDKYGIPYPEISAALRLPEGNLKIRRSQALRSLEEWVWDSQ